MILLIEDHRDTCEVLLLLLHFAGRKARCASTADEAVVILMELTPELIIVDDYLPHMNSVEFISLLRSDPATAHVPIVVYTAGVRAERRDKAFQGGATRWLEKARTPPAELVDACLSLLKTA